MNKLNWLNKHKEKKTKRGRGKGVVGNEENEGMLKALNRACPDEYQDFRGSMTE